ncbi:hypothetical protein DYY67_1180 [Candidatus Nitrosotalea sp. TS]|uniref:MFS transporter n=1 Tax=Candidatus Nitrosotalea sp. TS TaxID=2341020 RepID=UPI001EB7A3AC|nr:MFS transporter [Candidatus Nitrosotalea sp. TS]NHI04322.1 hypothetical protein [Candidatus Nitrosotalea sp. TS]
MKEDNQEPDKNTENKVPSSAWLALAIICGLALATMYGETMVLPAIPDFIKDFGISYNTSSWILSSYLISGAVMTPIAGKLSDIYGRKKILLIVMMIYSAGILAGGFANSLPFLLGARIAQGVGISMFPIAFGIVRDIFPVQKLGTAQGIFTSTFFGGSVIGLNRRRKNNLRLWLACNIFLGVSNCNSTCFHNEKIHQCKENRAGRCVQE